MIVSKKDFSIFSRSFIELRINIVQGHTIAPQVARNGPLLLVPAGVGLLAAAGTARPPGEELSRLPEPLLAVLDAVLRGVEYDFPLRVGVQTLVVTVALDLVLNVLLSVAGSSVGYLPRCFALIAEAKSRK